LEYISTATVLNFGNTGTLDPGSQNAGANENHLTGGNVMTGSFRILPGAAAVACFCVASTAWAQQDPAVGGQLNQCWGQVISQTAKLETPEGTKGGAMGQHARSTQAADRNGGFANSNNGFGITFNVKEEGETNAGRAGVGNATRGSPHFAEPGDGGNGQHAINNSSNGGLALSQTLNPVTGEFTTNAGGTAEVVDLSCDLVDAP
jgi:hypothetical protein